MKAHSCMAVLYALAITIATHSSDSSNDTHAHKKHKRKPSQQTQSAQNSQNTLSNYLQTQQTQQQVQQQQHQQMCNILGHASNIFNNFVHLVSKPNDKDNIGQQVGNMAQNIFHIVAEATKTTSQNKTTTSSQKDILDYLQSDVFVKELTAIIITQLMQLQ